MVALLWFVALLNYMDRQMLSTMRPSMQVDIAELESGANFGRLMAIFLWIYGIVSPFAGMLADKLNRKWLIVFSLFVWSGVTFAMGYADNFQQLYWLRAVMGFSEAIYIPTALALIADYHGSKTRSLAVGIHMTGLYLGQALGGFGATIAEQFSWQHAFLLFGLVGMAYSLVLVFFLREKKQTVLSSENLAGRSASRGRLFKGLSLLLSNISFWIILFYFAVPSVPGWGVKNWLPTLFSNKLNIDMATAGPLSSRKYELLIPYRHARCDRCPETVVGNSNRVIFDPGGNLGGNGPAILIRRIAQDIAAKSRVSLPKLATFCSQLAIIPAKQADDALIRYPGRARCGDRCMGHLGQLRPSPARLKPVGIL